MSATQAEGLRRRASAAYARGDFGYQQQILDELAALVAPRGRLLDEIRADLDSVGTRTLYSLQSNGSYARDYAAERLVDHVTALIPLLDPADLEAPVSDPSAPQVPDPSGSSGETAGCEFCAVGDHETCRLDDPDDSRRGQRCCCGSEPVWVVGKVIRRSSIAVMVELTGTQKTYAISFDPQDVVQPSRTAASERFWRDRIADEIRTRGLPAIPMVAEYRKGYEDGLLEAEHAARSGGSR